jgi:hypothetical protein
MLILEVLLNLNSAFLLLVELFVHFLVLNFFRFQLFLNLMLLVNLGFIQFLLMFLGLLLSLEFFFSLDLLI